MIDTHLHILPGIDDGPETMEESIALARALVQEGIHTAIATPHYNDLFPQRPAMEIKERVADLQHALDAQGIALRLFAGHEALIGPHLLADLHAGRIATLNESRYLLLELWSNAWIPETERVIFELRASGIIPIIAHPERYRFFQKEPQRMMTLHGVLFQMTASSLIGMQGRTAQHTAETLLRCGLVHCIASDAHGLRKRPPEILRSLERAIQVAGQVRIQRLTEDWPAAMIKDTSVEEGREYA